MKKKSSQIEERWKSLGPGLVTGAADDDPSGIATYSQAGAGYGFSFLWTALYIYPFMVVTQEMCARIGLVTKKGLAYNIRTHFNPKVLYLLVLGLAIANIVNIAANLAAMAAVTRLVFPGIHIDALVIFYGILILILEIQLSYKTYARYLKWLALATLSYVITAILAQIPWREALQNTLTPTFTFTKNSILMLTAILGTTISPYLFFWQSAQEVEEEQFHTHKSVPKKEVRNMRFDVWIGMLLSNIVMFAIIVTAGHVLGANGITEIETADQAASALVPFAGTFARTLFAIGIVGTGMLAIPVLAGSLSYAVAETFNWTSGLNKKLKQARAFYTVLIVSILIAIGITLIGIHPIKALIASAIFNGLISPFMLFFIIKLSGNRKIMGKYTNSPLTSLLGWILFFIMTLAGIGTVIAVV